MSSSVAYGLTAEYEGTVVQYDTAEDQEAGRGNEVPVFTGGIVAAGDRDVDLRELLDDEPHPGIIVVDETNTALIVALDEVPALKRVPVPENADPVTDVEAMTVGALRLEAKRERLEGYAGLKREQLQRAILERRARKQAAADKPSDEDLATAATVTDAELLADPSATTEED